MAKWVVTYYLTGKGEIPDFISHGSGQFAVGREYVGISVEDTERYLPSTVHKLSKAELMARALSLGLKDIHMQPLTNEQVEGIVDQYLVDSGLENYE